MVPGVPAGIWSANRDREFAMTNAIRAKIRIPVLPIIVVAFLGLLAVSTYLIAPGSGFQSDADAALEQLAASADSGGAFHVKLMVSRVSASGDVAHSKELWVDHAAGRLRSEVRDASGSLVEVRSRLGGEVFEIYYDAQPPRFENRRYLDPRIVEGQTQDDDLFLFKILMDAGVITSSEKVTLDNQDAIKLEVSPFGEDADRLVAYIDTDRGWPIKLDLYDEKASVPASSTKFQYDSIEAFDSTTLPDEYFTLTPPPGADTYVQTEMSVDEARAFTDFPVYSAGGTLLDLKLDRIQQITQQTSISPDVNQVSVIYSASGPNGRSVTITNLPAASVSGGVRADRESESVQTKFGQAKFYLQDGLLEIRAGTMLILIHAADRAEALAFSEALNRSNQASDPPPIPEDVPETAPTPATTPSPKPAPDPVLVPDPTANPVP
jgi:hypothetical protein